MSTPRKLLTLCGILLFASCTNPARNSARILVKNNLDIDRKELLSVKLADITDSPSESPWIARSGEEMSKVQVVDLNGDGVDDEIVFLVSIRANEEKQFVLSAAESKEESEQETRTYSRFVPERIDDYAWENDLVAFRTYGPEAQRLVEQGEKGGTLSSGLDCWLKRASYPVIDKWYKKYTDGGSYHKDDGDGYDPYHVGASRGCGGIGVWINDSLYVSRNFISYRKIADGPLRNIFELTYAPWMAENVSVRETKRITIDVGSQLYQVEGILTAAGPVPNYTIGITLHEKKGNVYADSATGVFSYWEPIDDSELGTAIVIDPRSLLGVRDYRTHKKDLSHLYVITKPNKQVVYHAGYAWKKAGAILTADDWNSYLKQFSQRLASPLQYSVE